MAKRRAEHAPLALTSNGIVVVNALSLLAPREAARLRRALPEQGDWFVAKPVPEAELEQVLARLDDAAAELAARLGARRLSPSPTTSPPAKPAAAKAPKRRRPRPRNPRGRER